jgi:hypothetical protein
MKPLNVISACVAYAIAIAVASTAPAAIVDDFSSATLDSAWVSSETLRQVGATAAISLETASNPGTLTWSFTTPNSGAVQTTLLRDDVALGVGEYLQARVSLNPSGGVTNAGQLFGGLIIDQASKTPTSDANIAGVNIDLLGGGQLIVQTGPNVQSGGTSTIGDYSDVRIRLTRATPNAIQGSYSLDGVNFNLVGQPMTVADVAAVGFFNGNARDSQAGTVQFDDFEISDAGFTSTPLLNVDFNSTAGQGPGPTQATDSFFGFDTGTLSQTFGGITVAVNDTNGRDRTPTSLSGAYEDLYRDFSLATELTLSDLLPDTAFLITFYAYDDAVDSDITTIFTDTTIGGLTAGVENRVTWNGGTNPGASLGTTNAATSLLVVSNSSGVLRFSITGDDARLNGFQLFMVVPEPGSFCLFGLGVALLSRIRRRNQLNS